MEEALEVIGSISFPCGCPRSDVLVYKGATGRASYCCAKCRRFAVFDFDELRAVPISPLRGGTLAGRTKNYKRKYD